MENLQGAATITSALHYRIRSCQILLTGKQQKRMGPKTRTRSGSVVLRRRKSSVRAPVHQTQHHSPARAWAERHHPGVVGEPAAGCIPSVPPVGGWGRLGASSWPQIRRWDRRRCCWRISGPPGGPEIRWILSVGWCPSKRVVVIHCARPYTAQKVSGGCVTAISGSASKFAEGFTGSC